VDIGEGVEVDMAEEKVEVRREEDSAMGVNDGYWEWEQLVRKR
jgi:hypothetical protein